MIQVCSVFHCAREFDVNTRPNETQADKDTGVLVVGGGAETHPEP